MPRVAGFELLPCSVCLTMLAAALAFSYAELEGATPVKGEESPLALCLTHERPAPPPVLRSRPSGTRGTAMGKPRGVAAVAWTCPPSVVRSWPTSFGSESGLASRVVESRGSGL